MVAIQLEYQGDLHSKAVHGPSGTELFTDAPKDNQGRGESFSPTDLAATALGSCMLTTMGILARTLNVDIAGATAVVERDDERGAEEDSAADGEDQDAASRSSEEEDRLKLERAAYTCLVAKSLHPEVEQVVEFAWG